MTEHQKTLDFAVFYSIFSVALGALGGFLIAIPISSTLMEGSSTGAIIGAAIVMPLFALLGARIGYRRRNSRLFFYVSFITVLVLLSMIATSLRG